MLTSRSGAEALQVGSKIEERKSPLISKCIAGYTEILRNEC